MSGNEKVNPTKEQIRDFIHDFDEYNIKDYKLDHERFKNRILSSNVLILNHKIVIKK